MLVEEHDRGHVVPCLICKTPIRVGGGEVDQRLTGEDAHWTDASYPSHQDENLSLD
jgi:hypothetical protein